jgi:hypothetical protein
MTAMTPNELLITLLNSATIGHVLHLQSRSYAEHKALQKFYEEMPELVDSVIEAWQGLHKEILRYPDQMVNVGGDNSAVDFIEYLKELLKNHRESLGDESEIQNLVDGIAELIDSTLYKLTFLH